MQEREKNTNKEKVDNIGTRVACTLAACKHLLRPDQTYTPKPDITQFNSKECLYQQARTCTRERP